MGHNTTDTMREDIDELVDRYLKTTQEMLAEKGGMKISAVMTAWLFFGFDVMFKAAEMNGQTIGEVCEQTCDHIRYFANELEKSNNKQQYFC